MWVRQGDGKPTLYLCKFFKLDFPWPPRFTGFATITYLCSFIFPLSHILSLAFLIKCRIPVGAVSSFNTSPINQVAVEPSPGMSCFIIIDGPITKTARRESSGKRKKPFGVRDSSPKVYFSSTNYTLVLGRNYR